MASSKHTARATSGARARRGRGRAGAHSPAGPVVLGPALTIAEVAQAARGFTAMLADGTARTDAGALESIDTAGLQLLLAVAAAAQERGLKLALHGAQELLHGAAHALGVGDDLAVAMELSA
ncbi:MAG: STAS domain-containing protein [Steroidobacteraceae bacterium]